MFAIVRNDGERRAVYFAMAVSYADEGNYIKAIDEMKKQYTLAKKINDYAGMAGDLIQMGNIYIEAGEPDEAMKKFAEAQKVMQGSNLSKEIKDNANRMFLYNSATVALDKKDFATAKAKLKQFHDQAVSLNNTFQIRQAHELAGRIALDEKNYAVAINEFGLSNQQNPYNLYRIALAYKGKGDTNMAKEFCKRAVNFNAFNNINQAFIRLKAAKMLFSL
ncbi:MAG: hypothetical protein A2Y62_17380 [Candidatus Fischerbacteria bacterium RBG_13_37_8]|uniref:Uncharacterized protein n=1 Tax=Candidatus Fischerbacteria bacterium RBG_13_37_8 TaxID=1817863 RepID=A0A1F5VP88_9BACT|nr:MAG: hypothetical protein A2Y62_17380 [Candidatus Fischerbacteria bacterium RBG_13_37_8]